jgi:citrate lyase subunit beta/citryl-CoA lyase
MRPARSLLFVPGHKADWIPKALRSGADAIIIDLEDAVPEADKQLARDNARAAIAEHGADATILVRTNALDTPHFGADADAVCVDGLGALLLPKIYDRDDLLRFDGVITAAEHRNGVPPAAVPVVVSLETAASVENVGELARGPRVVGVMGAAAKGADISRDLGFRWTPGGAETLYLRSKTVTAARSAGLRLIVLGLWQEVNDLAGLRTFARDNAGLGFTGQVIIHPSHAAVVNEEYGLTADQLDYYTRLVAAFDAAVAEGDAAVRFEGEHIDIAHANYARQLVRAATAGRGAQDTGEEHP